MKQGGGGKGGLRGGSPGGTGHVAEPLRAADVEVYVERESGLM